MRVDTSPFNLKKLVEESISLFATAAKKKDIQLQVSYSDGLGTEFSGDGVKIRQVLSNLLSNAIKFTSVGLVHVEVSPASEQGLFGRVRMAVVDSGIGIAQAELPNLFRDFYQVDGSATRRYGGTGLGLAIAQRLVRLMGGVIGVSSTPGEGTRFWLEVPLRPVCALTTRAITDSSARDREALQFSGSVLVAEDNPVSQEVIKTILEHLGLSVEIATNGREALEKVADNTYTMVFMDCQMPELDGYEATSLIRGMDGPGSVLPIVALTAHAMVGDREKCLAAGMTDYLSKPIDRQELLKVVRRWCKQLA